MKAFVTSDFGGRSPAPSLLHSKINSYYERALRITYEDEISSSQNF